MLKTKRKTRARQRNTRSRENDPPKVRWRGGDKGFWDVDSWALDPGPFVEIDGKMVVRQDVEFDDDEKDEDGKLNKGKYKAGETFFPALYFNEALGFVGETIDARRSGDGNEWHILLFGVYRDEMGEPVLVDPETGELDPEGEEIPCGLWMRESALEPFPNEDNEIEEISFIPGHTRNVNIEWVSAHTEKLVGFRAFHSIGGRLVVEKRDMTEEDWRWWSEHQDQPAKRDALLEGREFKSEGWSRPEGSLPVVRVGRLGYRLRGGKMDHCDLLAEMKESAAVSLKWRIAEAKRKAKETAAAAAAK